MDSYKKKFKQKANYTVPITIQERHTPLLFNCPLFRLSQNLHPPSSFRRIREGNKFLLAQPLSSIGTDLQRLGFVRLGNIGEGLAAVINIIML